MTTRQVGCGSLAADGGQGESRRCGRVARGGARPVAGTLLRGGGRASRGCRLAARARSRRRGDRRPTQHPRRRRGPRRRRQHAEGCVQLRSRLRQHRRRCRRGPWGPSHQHPGRVDERDGGARRRADAGGRTANHRGGRDHAQRRLAGARTGAISRARAHGRDRRAGRLRTHRPACRRAAPLLSRWTFCSRRARTLDRRATAGAASSPTSSPPRTS